MVRGLGFGPVEICQKSSPSANLAVMMDELAILGELTALSQFI